MLSIWRRNEKLAFPFKIPGPSIPIVSDAAIATTAVGDGRLIPVVILDTTDRPDVAELIELQTRVPPGDVVSAWGQIIGGPKYHLALFLHFQRPMELGAAINFDLSRQGSVVELALRAGAIYLQAGKPGDRLYKTLEQSRMITELGGTLPPDRWDDAWTKAVVKRLRSEGLRNGHAKKAAAFVIKEMRERFNNQSSLESGVYIEPSTATTDDVGLLKAQDDHLSSHAL